MSSIDPDVAQSEVRQAKNERVIAQAQRDTIAIQRDSALIANSNLKNEVREAQVWAAKTAVNLRIAEEARIAAEEEARTNGTALSILLGCIAILLLGIVVWYFLHSATPIGAST